MKKIALFIIGFYGSFQVSAQSRTIDSLRSILSSSVDSSKVDQYTKISKEWLSVNPDSALIYANKGFDLASTLRYRLGMAEARSIQGKVYLEKGVFAQAYEYYLEALHKYTILNDERGIAEVYVGLGTTYERQENYSRALQYFQKAIILYKKTDSKLGLANAYLNMGIVHSSTDQHQKALTYFQDAVHLAEGPSGDKKIAISIYNNMGRLYASMRQYKKGLHALIRAKNLALIAAQLPSVAEAYLNIGDAYLRLNQFDSSAISFNIALNYFIQLKNTESIARTYHGIAGLNFRQKDFDKARQFIRLSNEFADQIKNNQVKFDNYSLLVDISKASGDYKQAFAYYEKVLSLKDVLLNAEKISSIENIKATYELEKKQETIEELQEENEVKTRQRNYLIFAFSLAATTLVLLAYTFFQIKKNAKLLQEQKKQLEDQKNELEKQKKELEDLHVVKDKFFSVLSHDLRSPMGNILGLLNLITMDGIIGEDEKKQLFNRLKLSTSSALETMDNMLAWGKNQIKENKTEIKEVNIYEVAERVCRLLSQIADGKSIKLVNQINPTVNIRADKNRLEFVIRNLMSNALKFSHKNSRIEMWTSADDIYINIHVKDFGTGMKRELQEKLFDVNQRESVNGTAGETGSGLGLALSKEFITQNNGDILVNSEPGQGTIFTIQHRWN